VAASRERLLESPLGLVEDLRRRERSPQPAFEDYSPRFQVCLPYRGLFLWRVGCDEIVGDPNQVVFVRGGEGSFVHGPLADGYAELILTPAHEVIAELAHANGTPLDRHPLFRRRARRADPGLQMLRARLLHRMRGRPPMGALEAEEALLELLRHALRADEPAPAPPGPGSARLLLRAKGFLEAELHANIHLADVARYAGASPAYLTDLFRRVEGVSLHRYLVQLRLARALVELKHASDLTALALEVGFSSHSHFTAAFRRAFGTTPSEFRRSAGHA
jgi:AraC-like DNA-binding protein